MTRKLILSCALAGVVGLAGCASMSSTEQRTLSGAALGTAAGVAVGAITGDWLWAAGGAAIGAGAGYLYDQQKKKEQTAQEKAYQDGLKAGRTQSQQK